MKRGSLLEGWRKTSPIPPPFLRPWFIVVTKHMKSVSQLRSFSASRSGSTTELVAEQDSDGEESREEVRGWVSIRKSSGGSNKELQDGQDRGVYYLFYGS